jgi:predicted small lipoprotein YifL
MAALLSGCGQKGGLYLPQEPEAQQRATLPQILTPSLPGTSKDTLPTSPPSSR